MTFSAKTQLLRSGRKSFFDESGPEKSRAGSEEGVFRRQGNCLPPSWWGSVSRGPTIFVVLPDDRQAGTVARVAFGGKRLAAQSRPRLLGYSELHALITSLGSEERRDKCVSTL